MRKMAPPSKAQSESPRPERMIQNIGDTSLPNSIRLFGIMLRKMRADQSPPFDDDPNLSEPEKKWLNENFDKFVWDHLQSQAEWLGYSPKGRKLRKTNERPRPDLPSDAPENRTRKIVSTTLPPDVLSEVNARCSDLHITRAYFIEVAVRAALKATS